jgi:epoxyqueuosine reductase
MNIKTAQAFSFVGSLVNQMKGGLSMTSDTGAQIIDKAKEMGASMAGIASVELLKKSPSNEIIKKLGMEIDGVGTILKMTDFYEIKWPAEVKSALVIAVSHPQDKPELDWMVGYKGTLGNSMAMRINRKLSAWIEETFNIKTHKMSYHVEKGGIYLKDAAVLAGFGCIGKNNILVTPELGPRVRFRAMLLEEELSPTGPIEFDPCDGCEEFCRKPCPQKAYDKIVLSSVETGMVTLPGRDGCFSRAKCMIQMDKDDEDAGIDINETLASAIDIEDIGKTRNYIKPCRRCELACPVGS